MTKLKTIIISSLGALAIASATVFAKDFDEGEHYTVISSEVAKPDIKEYFSAYCPHCEMMEPYINSARKKIRESKRKYDFERSHVSFLGGVPKSIQRMVTSSMFLAEKLEKQDEYVEFLFHKIHKEGVKISTPESLQEAMKQFGFTDDEIKNEMLSSDIQEQTVAAIEEQERLVRGGKLKGVPSFVINGKYLVNLSGLDRKNFEQDLADIIIFLKEKE